MRTHNAVGTNYYVGLRTSYALLTVLRNRIKASLVMRDP